MNNIHWVWLVNTCCRKLTFLLFLLLFTVLANNALAISLDDARFCLERELVEILVKHHQTIEDSVDSVSPGVEWLDFLSEYAKQIKDAALAAKCHKLLAVKHKRLESAVQWILLAEGRIKITEEERAETLSQFRQVFTKPEDKLVIDVYAEKLAEDVYFPRITELASYNEVIEVLAKERIDEISVERSDSLALKWIVEFKQQFPKSRYQDIAFYYELYHLSNRNDHEAIIEKCLKIDAEVETSFQMRYVACLYLLSPTLRKSIEQGRQTELLDRCITILENMRKATVTDNQVRVLFDTYDLADWHNKIDLLRLKLHYYKLIASKGLFGDEDTINSLFKNTNREYRRLIGQVNKIERKGFSSNDRGERSELYFWKGKILALIDQERYLTQAVEAYAKSLIWGSPRKRYDEEAEKSILAIHRKIGIKRKPMNWVRSLLDYNGIIFEDITEDAGIGKINYTRVALGDYDNDGKPDILLNGNKLYKNEGDLKFSDVSVKVGIDQLKSNGGLFADFNLDGNLDFGSISHAEDGLGEQLMKNMIPEIGKFVSVNERAGNVDDGFPTEGAAWVDPDQSGYPDLYLANYEKWQVRNGFPDKYWKNENGYFSDRTKAIGIDPEALGLPDMAGRGVAPADFDNDGIQEILVTNYRLQRNFCWKLNVSSDRSDPRWKNPISKSAKYQDVAALYNLHGKNKQGYYGHSIGADWGDIDNDGDLDLFIANLAHPRFIDISDISMLLRNDGLEYRIVEQDTIYYWKFTDITRKAGITYDELHSDPLFFDADNDGLLDLFITSVYANDRTYLYRNNGDGTFSDITWLAGARVFNGWGNACADFDGDGRLDLVVGSGNGTKLLHNQTENSFSYIMVKPIWIDGQVHLLKNNQDYPKMPNSPAFGTRVKITTTDENGRESDYIRELSSAKGTTSQSDQVLHFGLGTGKLKSIERVNYVSDQD